MNYGDQRTVLLAQLILAREKCLELRAMDQPVQANDYAGLASASINHAIDLMRGRR